MFGRMDGNTEAWGGKGNHWTSLTVHLEWIDGFMAIPWVGNFRKTYFPLFYRLSEC